MHVVLFLFYLTKIFFIYVQVLELINVELRWTCIERMQHYLLEELTPCVRSSALSYFETGCTEKNSVFDLRTFPTDQSTANN